MVVGKWQPVRFDAHKGYPRERLLDLCGVFDASGGKALSKWVKVLEEIRLREAVVRRHPEIQDAVRGLGTEATHEQIEHPPSGFEAVMAADRGKGVAEREVVNHSRPPGPTACA